MPCGLCKKTDTKDQNAGKERQQFAETKQQPISCLQGVFEEEPEEQASREAAAELKNILKEYGEEVDLLCQRANDTGLTLYEIYSIYDKGLRLKKDMIDSKEALPPKQELPTEQGQGEEGKYEEGQGKEGQGEEGQGEEGQGEEVAVHIDSYDELITRVDEVLLKMEKLAFPNVKSLRQFGLAIESLPMSAYFDIENPDLPLRSITWMISQLTKFQPAATEQEMIIIDDQFAKLCDLEGFLQCRMKGEGEEFVCRTCGSTYKEEDNSDTACRFHSLLFNSKGWRCCKSGNYGDEGCIVTRHKPSYTKVYYRCKRCRGKFALEDNNYRACSFHPNHYDGEAWKCCLSPEKCTDGCTFDSHVLADWEVPKAGLKSMGETCLNSLLQVLVALEWWRHLPYLSPSEGDTLAASSTPLFREICKSTEVVDPTDFHKRFSTLSNGKHKIGRRVSAHEVLSDLLSCFQKELIVDPIGSNVISDAFQVDHVETKVCQNCYKSKSLMRQDWMWEISPRDTPNLLDSFKEFCGSSVLTCKSCRSETIHKKTRTITKWPQTLVIKIDRPVKLGQRDSSKVIIPAKITKGLGRYELKAMLQYVSVNENNGYFAAMIGQLGMWRKITDTVIEPNSALNVLSDSAILVFYEHKDDLVTQYIKKREKENI